MSAERRSSGRQRFRPLDFWANERVVYEPSLEGPVLAGVLTQDPRGMEAVRAESSAADADPGRSPAKRARSRSGSASGCSRGSSSRGQR
eukprot:148455-Prymnesium_polylepis.1